MNSTHTLWYGAPAAAWTQALPLGNGRLGAMVFGGPLESRFQLNEDSLWSGLPHAYTVPGAKEALARARALVEKHRCGAAVECRLGDGLHVLSPDEADDIVIAGVSGVTAAEMLAAAPQFWRAGKRFIFVPATKRAELRGWLWKNGFSLLDETPVQAAGRFYTALCAEYTGRVREPSLLECAVGLAAKPTPAAAGYLRHVPKLVRKYTLGVPLAENAPFVQLAGQVDAMAERCEQEAQKWMLKK